MIAKRIVRPALFAVLSILVVSAGMAPAHTASHPGAPATDPAETPAPAAAVHPEEARARAYFTDLPVVTHDGQRLRFYSDVLKDRVVGITFFFVDCEGMCPLVNQKLAAVQQFLGDRFGKDLFLITISIDPEQDTPAALTEYRKQFDAQDGWLFLTGEKAHIDTITRRLGQVYPKETHSPLIILGNVNRAHWRKVQPNIPAQGIALQLQQLADGGGVGGTLAPRGPKTPGTAP